MIWFLLNIKGRVLDFQLCGNDNSSRPLSGLSPAFGQFRPELLFPWQIRSHQGAPHYRHSIARENHAVTFYAHAHLTTAF